MSFGPPRKAPSGLKPPGITRTSSTTVRRTPSETTTTSITTTSIPRSAASSARPSTGIPCGSGNTSRSRGRDSSGIPSYGRQRPTTAPQSVCPGSGAAQRKSGPPSSGIARSGAPTGGRTLGGRRPSETITSVSSITRDAQGGETIMEREERVIQQTPATRVPRPGGPSGRPSGVCPGAARGASRPTGVPRPAGRTPAAPSGGNSKVTTRSSTTVFSDGSRVQESSSRTETGGPRKSSGYGPPRKTVCSSASAASVASTSSAETGRKVHTTTSRTSKTSVKCGKKTTTTQEVKKIVPELPEGRYSMPLKYAPHTKEGKYKKFSSPPGIRRKMDADTTKGLKLIPPEFKGVQDIKKLTAFKPYQDTVSCSMQIRRGKESPSYRDPYASSFLDETIEPEYSSPYRSPTAGERSALGEQRSILEQEVEQQLMQAAALTPSKAVRASGSRKSPATPHIIMTDQGPVTATEQVITEKKVEKSPGSEKISRHMIGIEQSGCGAIQMELDSQAIEPGAGLRKKGETARETVSVKSSVAIAPGGIKETTTTVIYETIAKPSPLKKITMSPEQVERLVEEEAIDVNKALKLKPLDLKIISPKSYPVRKREHELKLYTSLLELEHSVVLPEPSPDQEQEEIQPEMVATIMYTEEQGMGLETQPTQVYDMLFPQAQDASMMTVNSVAPKPLQDVLVPAQLPDNFHAQGATTEIEAATTSVETTGETKPSGNAFTESGGAQPASKNVAKRGGRRKATNVPILAQEAPPWGSEDMKPILDIVGAPLNANLGLDSPEDRYEEENKEAQDEECTMDYMLQLEPPTHSSRIQLRGSTRPPWFQGYYLALPDIPDLVQVSKVADHALSCAWRAVQPNYFPDDSIISI